jgi:hypothetical protein
MDYTYLTIVQKYCIREIYTAEGTQKHHSDLDQDLLKIKTKKLKILDILFCFVEHYYQLQIFAW